MTDPISDMLTRIRNASKIKKQHVDVPASRVKFAIAKILEAEGFAEKVEMVQSGTHSNIRIHLKYDGRQPAITTIDRVSTPGRRIYAKSNALPRVQSGYGIAIVSTSNGLMTNKEAMKRHLGGEIICEVF